MRVILGMTAILLMGGALCGCVAVDAAGTVASAAGTVAGTAVDVGASAVSTAADTVSGGSSDDKQN